MLLGANQALSPVVTFMTLQFTLMARECFDALQNSYVKVILAGRSSGEITDEEAAQKVLAEYFEKNPDHLPTSNGRRFFCIASYDQRAIIKFSIQQNLYDLSTIFSPLRFFLDRNGGKEPKGEWQWGWLVGPQGAQSQLARRQLVRRLTARPRAWLR